MKKQEILGVAMVPVGCVNVSLLTSYLCQADGVLIVTLRAYSGTVPDACQNAIWAAAGLVEKAISVVEASRVSDAVYKIDDALIDGHIARVLGHDLYEEIVVSIFEVHKFNKIRSLEGGSALRTIFAV